MTRIKATDEQIAENDCECGDKGCPVHQGEETCNLNAAVQLFRVDMDDQTGTLMCEKCAEDAFDSGLFTDSTDSDDDSE